MSQLTHPGGLASLIVQGRDRTGIVATVSAVLSAHQANIVSLDQYSDDPSGGAFFQRTVFTLDGVREALPRLQADLEAALADEFELTVSLRDMSVPKRVGILASKSDHCLVDLLYRHKSGELACEIPLVISNHPDNGPIADFYRIPFFVVSVTKENKTEAEQKILALLKQHNPDFIVLARYMQILSNHFVNEYPHRIINIHHSFLPAFVGAKPYHQAFTRGVKLIGATSHYVTDVLDDGPIIEQDVVRISHRDSLDDLLQKGRDLEKVVLSRAVRWHIENRVLLYGNKTVVFD